MQSTPDLLLNSYTFSCIYSQIGTIFQADRSEQSPQSTRTETTLVCMKLCWPLEADRAHLSPQNPPSGPEVGSLSHYKTSLKRFRMGLQQNSVSSQALQWFYDFLSGLIGSLSADDMEPLTLLIIQSVYRVQTSLFMLDSSSLELICDALGLPNILICDPTERINRKRSGFVSLMFPKTHNALRTAGLIWKQKRADF